MAYTFMVAHAAENNVCPSVIKKRLLRRVKASLVMKTWVGFFVCKRI